MKRDIDLIVEEWRGKGKINILSVHKTDGEKWEVEFIESRKRQTVIFDTHVEAEEFSFEFGGKNNFTIATDPIFLFFSGWDKEKLFNMGHILVKLKLGQGESPSGSERPVAHVFSEDCGYAYLPGSSKKDPKTTNFCITEKIIYRNTTRKGTVIFRKPSELETLRNEMASEGLSEYKIPVEAAVTKHHENLQFCTWVRKKVGDGSKTMEMRLEEVDGVHYSELRFKDLLAIADGMGIQACERVFLKKKKEYYQDRCGLSIDR